MAGIARTAALSGERTSFAGSQSRQRDPSRLADRVADVVLACAYGRAGRRCSSQRTDGRAQHAEPTAMDSPVGRQLLQSGADVIHVQGLTQAVMVRTADRPLLERTGPASFRAGGLSFEFRREGNDPATRVIAAAGRVRNLSFVRR